MDLRIPRSPLETKCCHVPRGGTTTTTATTTMDLVPRRGRNIGNLSSAAKQALSRNDKNQTGKNRAPTHRFEIVSKLHVNPFAVEFIAASLPLQYSVRSNNFFLSRFYFSNDIHKNNLHKSPRSNNYHSCSMFN